MKPTPHELDDLRSDALDPRFTAAMRASARSVERWEREHATPPNALLRAIDALTRLFPALSPDRRTSRGDRFPLL